MELTTITKLDLRNHKYPMDILRENIYALHLLEIIETQIIDEQFAVDYILNPIYQLTPLEKNITTNDVLFNQPHMNYETLMRIYIIGPTETFRVFESVK